MFEFYKRDPVRDTMKRNVHIHPRRIDHPSHRSTEQLCEHCGTVGLRSHHKLPGLQTMAFDFCLVDGWNPLRSPLTDFGYESRGVRAYRVERWGGETDGLALRKSSSLYIWVRRQAADILARAKT